MFKRTEVVPLLTNEELVIKASNTLGQLDSFSKRINVSKGSSITRALITLEASQTYLSGAEVVFNLNTANLKPSLHWEALENKTKKQTYDVTSQLSLGVNTFSAVYKIAYGTITDQKASVTASLTIELSVPDTTSAGVTTGNTTSNDTLRNVGQRVREGIIYIVALAATVGVLVLYFYAKGHPLKFKSL
jgi:hypothetical protein